MVPPRLLVANRGEIAVRVLSSARELGLHTIAVSTADDNAHASYAHESIQLPSVSSYTDVGLLVSLCKEHRIDLVHPGYGFLSESAEFCKQLLAARVTFIGPGPQILRQTGDKLSARRLAEEHGVPVLPALGEPVKDIEDSRRFAHEVGFPLMLKAVDGGGGRGIRLVRSEKDLEASFRRASNESPSNQVFAEKAAIDGFRHVEVQIIGDGRGDVRHFWERECSIQRRFQKVIEKAPSSVENRLLITAVIDSALRMAQAIKYSSLGTWEFLVSPASSTYFFMEINPRLQVEHTITEAISGIDLVRSQILIALGKSFVDIGIDTMGSKDASRPPPPASTAIQLRVTAEDPRRDFAASIGRIKNALFPGGNGIRVDSHLRPGLVVSADFDSLVAKVIVTAMDWTAAVNKAQRALQDVAIDGIATNIDLLQRIIHTDDFHRASFDTQWLEQHLENLLREDQSISRHANTSAFRENTQVERSITKTSSAASDQLVRKGDHFDIQIEGEGLPTIFRNNATVSSITRNDFPNSLALSLSTGNNNPDSPKTATYNLKMSKRTDAQHSLKISQRGDMSNTPADASSVLLCPVSGQLIEVLVDEGDIVSEGDAIIVVRQMKMELEIRAHRSGAVRGLFQSQEGDHWEPGT
ncbi:hypothetical protein M406DRAFT_343069 [Cryphonectria parasitica EP155]|uniref:Pyruvate carboxylase n=1 Tax=Cryphonectria parasitica (strain ATCC 38755 / EP155) TaxID=660469 RepID=A0A9P4XUD9_CRYP1|nr:uncharacterized protein M406DRAFT_343069 [Cryphonectria parasitica EP155]KAF3760915.1 hypothetical protein M406DRAFT_343069 [Cryphonectria parasitica EP155]